MGSIDVVVTSIAGARTLGTRAGRWKWTDFYGFDRSLLDRWRSLPEVIAETSSFAKCGFAQSLAAFVC
jgi:hypothetical protein